jgi:hypothetical protein
MRQLVCALAAVLALVAAPAARAEPLDFDLARLGAPDPDVWTSIFLVSGTTGDKDALARESRQRFAVLSTEMALALSSAVLHPASTTGHSGFDVDLEVATVAVHSDAIGAAPPAPFTNSTWPANTQPTQLYLPSLHVRKALPFSFEFGGRMIYLSQSSYFAAQGEAKWALNEGFEYVPDVAVRVAYTRLFGQKDWNLGATDLDLLVSKRWGLNGVTSVTPYFAGRFTYVSASSERIDFAPERPAPTTDPVDLVNTQASFPRFSAGFYRSTLGLRFTAYVVSLALEGTYFGGSSPKVSGYDGVKIASSFGGAAKLGWEF